MVSFGDEQLTAIGRILQKWLKSAYVSYEEADDIVNKTMNTNIFFFILLENLIHNIVCYGLLQTHCLHGKL
jgi:hypothetical protein